MGRDVDDSGLNKMEKKIGLVIPEKANDKKSYSIKSSGLFDSEEQLYQRLRKEKPLIRPKSEIIQSLNEEEDESIYQYDEVFEQESSEARNKARLVQMAAKGNDAPKYHSALMAAAERRKRERAATRIQTFRREAQEGEEASNREERKPTEVFVTAAYKRKLEEMKAKGIDVDKVDDKEEEDRRGRTQDGASYAATLYRNNVRLDRSREYSPEGRR